MREFFRVKKITRKWDRSTGKFHYDIRFKTRTEVTPRTVAVAEAFGLGVDEYQEHIIYDNVELKIGPQDIVYITGESGSGKSVLLKALEKDLGDQAINIGNVTDGVTDGEKPLIDTIGETMEEGLELLSRVGLNDAFLFVRRYSELSDGQKYRYRIAKLIESGRQFWVMDEFCATLDRDTAKIVAFNVQKLARRYGKAVLAATTHTDLFEDLYPSVHIHKRFGKEIHVDYYPNESAEKCSLTKEMHLVKASLKDYKTLAHFHYRDSKGIPVVQKVFALKREEETVGVIVYKSPGVMALGRSLVSGRKIELNELNKDWTLIARVVIHPKYRTIGLGAKIVKDTLFKCGRPYVESIAVMARYNPFFERAGMQKIIESTPDKRILQTLLGLEEIGFDLTFLSSEAYNLHKLHASMETREKVKKTLRELGCKSGIYRKRLASSGQAFLNKNEFEMVLEKADEEKLAKMLRILSFLAQPKVYLFWKNEPAISFTQFLSQNTLQTIA